MYCNMKRKQDESFHCHHETTRQEEECVTPTPLEKKTTTMTKRYAEAKVNGNQDVVKQKIYQQTYIQPACKKLQQVNHYCRITVIIINHHDNRVIINQTKNTTVTNHRPPHSPSKLQPRRLFPLSLSCLLVIIIRLPISCGSALPWSTRNRRWWNGWHGLLVIGLLICRCCRCLVGLLVGRLLLLRGSGVLLLVGRLYGGSVGLLLRGSGVLLVLLGLVPV
mmetsp:Transcript_41683/g.50744  ORF Transcript_41683/g.50744 Transcript_41683/m.50744 type:complete len:221 (+) Transcript_41683:360-1022(+)